MILSRSALASLNQDSAILPPPNLFNLPEKVIQFGTGVLLRGLPDYFIDKANRQGVFNGRVVVIKSTDSGDSITFDKQDGLYTVCVRGILDGKNVEENSINSAISRVLSARSQWDQVLMCAHNPEMKLVISNTTEVGIRFLEEDIRQQPPVSFPGKLLSFLYERYNAFGGSNESGMVIIPTELITENGSKLEAIVHDLARQNSLEQAFTDWLKNSNHFCNSLVDRIVPGAPAAVEKLQIETKLGYRDDLLLVAEAYKLWAIESGSEKVKEILSFSQVDEGVAIAPDITRFRELKLRLLNGTHTLSCGLAILAGFGTVKEALENEAMNRYVSNLMRFDIAPAIVGEHISEQEASQFAISVLDRFRNPQIDHKWISISAQFTSKMKMRNLPVLLSYYSKFQSVPEYFVLGFAAYLLFMRSKLKEDGKYAGEASGREYIIQDDKAAYLSEKWNSLPLNEFVENIMRDESLWEMDLTALIGFSAAVTARLKSLINDGALQVMQNRLVNTLVGF
ncbi:MAG: tagaturonate reductase [Chitinophagaceae bacterium]